MMIKNVIFCLTLMWLMLVTLTSCESKRDDNGDLGGMWQLTEWTDAYANNKYDKTDCTIYLKVRREYAQFQEMPCRSEDLYILCYLQRQGDDLHFSHFWRYPSSQLCEASYLRPYGMPSDSTLHIAYLSNQQLILTSGDSIRMTFRKY